MIYLRELGIIVLAICPLLIGLTYSVALKRNQTQIDELIQLITWLKIDIRYNQSQLGDMVNRICSSSKFNNLNFLNNLKNNMMNMPFPNAWEKSISDWNSSISQDDKDLLKSMSSILGASDANGQIMALEHVEHRFKISLQSAREVYNKKGKLFRSLGILIGLAVFVVFM